MNKIAKLDDETRRILFRNTAQKMGLHEAIVEKDFWVCFMLDYLFSKSEWKDSFTFKGGTSLSKCYHLIERFSEDIDLILDWRVIGYKTNEPWVDRSNMQQEKFNKDANLKAASFLKEELLPKLISDVSVLLDREAVFYIDEGDPQTICFEYPRIFSDASILQMIRLEIGALAAWSPATKKVVIPFVANYYPHLFEDPKINILTVSVERTFWEKITILHHEANRPEKLKLPSRYSRHYYDLYCIAKSKFKECAFNNLGLLEQVVDFKKKFYPRKWAKYEEAVPGTLKLVPPLYRFSDLAKDYKDMKEMFYGDYPEFDELMKMIKCLEDEINKLK